MRYITPDLSDILFRSFFSMIFLGLGCEHILSDALIQELMPFWIPYPRYVSISCGLLLIICGSLIALGLYIRHAAFALAVFLVIVTFAVHVPGVLVDHPELPEKFQWMWKVLQRSNLAKNLCLIGVCMRLIYYTPGKYSLDARMNSH